MLPHIDSNDRCTLDFCHAVHQRVIFVVGLSNDKVALLTASKPDPTWKDSSHNSFLEYLSKALIVGEVLLNHGGELSARLFKRIFVRKVSLLTLQKRPKEEMIEVTADSKSLWCLVKSSGLLRFD